MALTNSTTPLAKLQQRTETDEKPSPKQHVVILRTATGFKKVNFF